MYGTPGSSSYAATHTNTNDSELKKSLDTWYENNLKNYTAYLVDDGFCNDRSVLETIGNYGVSSMETHYKGYARITASLPSLKCSQSDDLFTTSSASIGNKALIYPIATITADEVMLAGSSGGMFDGNWNKTKESANYLDIGKEYWTITPAGFFAPYEATSLVSGVFCVGTNGSLDDYWVYQLQGTRPVINLRSDAIKSGNGEVNTPYKVM